MHVSQALAFYQGGGGSSSGDLQEYRQLQKLDSPTGHFSINKIYHKRMTGCLTQTSIPSLVLHRHVAVYTYGPFLTYIHTVGERCLSPTGDLASTSTCRRSIMRCTI